MVETAATACPTLETLAAFVDGRLDAVERRALVVHLADCERCDEVVSLVLTTEAEVREEPASTGAMPAPSADPDPAAPLPFRPRLRRFLPWALPLAAVLATVVLWRPWVPPALDVDGLTLGLGSPGRHGVFAGVLADHEEWRRYRGEAPPTSDEEEAAFKTGVRLVDLAVALDSGDRKLAFLVAADLERVLPGIESADPALSEARRIRGRLGPTGDGGAGREDVVALDGTLTEILAGGDRAGLYLRLGAWAEARRLEVLVGVAPDAGALRRTARRFRDAGFPPPIDEALVTTLDLAEGGLSPGELAEVGKTLGELVESGVERP